MGKAVYLLGNMDMDRDITPICAFSEVPAIEVVAEEIEKHYVGLGWLACDPPPPKQQYILVAENLIQQLAYTKNAHSSLDQDYSYLLDKVELK